MKKTAILLSVIFATIAPIAFAHGNLYFEFAPDNSSPHTVALYQTPAQPFYPPNDFIGGVDVWIDNDGSAGSVSFGLRDQNNTLLTSQTVTIPYTPKKYGGTRFHVDFPSQTPVNNNNIYYLRAITSLSNFALHKASLFQILQHNSQYYADYVVEPANLGTTPQNFAFKFALYENQEYTPPVLTNIKTNVLSYEAVQISFNANEPVDYHIQFWPTNQLNLIADTGWTNAYTYCGANLPACSVSLNTAPLTNYSFSLFAKDSWGNTSQSTGSFTTPAGSTPAGGPPPPSGPGQPPPPPPSENPPPPSPSGGPPPSPIITPPAGPPSTGGPPPPPSANPGPPPPSSPTASGQELGSSGTAPPAPGANAPPTPSSNIPTPENPVIAYQPESNPEDLIIKWLAPEIEPSLGYKIQIIDAKTGKIIKEIRAPRMTREVKVSKLAPGKYLLVVYMVRDDGSLEKISDPILYTFALDKTPSSAARAYAPIVIVIILALPALGFLLRKRKR